jgi:hypothetical protein
MKKSRITEGSPVNISPRKTEKHQLNKLHRRLLPFYMKPAILIAFMMISLIGILWSWITAVYLSHVNPFWCSFGFAFGIVLGYIHGKWTARMWERDYLRVSRREITFWKARGATGTTVYVILALGAPIFIGLSLGQSYEILAGLQSYIFGFIDGMNLALYLWVRQLPR